VCDISGVEVVAEVPVSGSVVRDGGLGIETAWGVEVGSSARVIVTVLRR
jgi:hypothetical protein